MSVWSPRRVVLVVNHCSGACHLLGGLLVRRCCSVHPVPTDPVGLATDATHGRPGREADRHDLRVDRKFNHTWSDWWSKKEVIEVL